MNDTTLKFRIGVFVLASLVVLAVLVILFSGFPTLFSQHYRYTVVLPNAAGIGAGTPVRRSGVRIGEVENVELDNQNGLVRVAVLVNKKYVLRHDEQAVLSRNLLGETAIDFRPLSAAAAVDHSPIESGSDIIGQVPTDAQALLNQADKLLPNTEQAVRELGKAAEAFNKIAPDFSQAVREVRDLSRATRETIPDLRKTNDEALVALRNWGRLGERLDVLVRTEQDKVIKTLEDFDQTLNRVARVFSDENQRNLGTTLKNVRAASDNFESIGKNADAFVKEGRQTLRRLNKSLEQTDEVLTNLQKTTKPLAERSERVMKNLDESTDRLNRTLTDVQALIQAFSRSEGTLSKLLNDPGLYNNLNDASCMMLHILPRIDRMLKDLEVFADKIARHPEALGVGGAVRPGSGIK